MRDEDAGERGSRYKRAHDADDESSVLVSVYTVQCDIYIYSHSRLFWSKRPSVKPAPAIITVRASFFRYQPGSSESPGVSTRVRIYAYIYISGSVLVSVQVLLFRLSGPSKDAGASDSERACKPQTRYISFLSIDVLISAPSCVHSAASHLLVQAKTRTRAIASLGA